MRPRGATRPAGRNRTSTARRLPLCVLFGAALAVAIGSTTAVAPPADRTGNSGLVSGSCTPGARLLLNETGESPSFLVAFELTIPTTRSANVSWSFGDGSYLSGPFSVDSTPVHSYNRSGTFEATVVAVSASGTYSCSAMVVSPPSPLSTHITATPMYGTAPLTVHFVGSAAGGTGTFSSFAWDFGDGIQGAGLSLNYTYVLAGSYGVTLSVTDSKGSVAHDQVRINVTADPSLGNRASPRPDWGGGTALVETLVGVGVVGIAAFAVTSTVFRIRRRALGGTAPPNEERIGVAMLVDALAHLSPAHPAMASDSSPGGGPTARLQPESGSPSIASSVPIATNAPPEPRAAGPIPEGVAPPRPTGVSDSLHLSQRVVLHLAQLPAHVLGDLAPVSRTQRGIGAALQVRQGPLANVLTRLVLAGLVEVDLGHVHSATRRLKVYRLTPVGERIARGLRLRPRTDTMSGPDTRGSGRLAPR